VANIHRSRKSGVFLRGGVARRETQWLDIEPVRSGIVAGGALLMNSLSTVEKALRPFTVVRSRGQFAVKSDQVAASEPYGFGYGICIVSDQASAIGITAVPTPMTDQESDLWFVYEYLAQEFVFVTGAGFDSQGAAMREYDSKAMRKVEDGQDLVIVGEVPSSATSEGVVITNSGRVLIKLH